MYCVQVAYGLVKGGFFQHVTMAFIYGCYIHFLILAQWSVTVYDIPLKAICYHI